MSVTAHIGAGLAVATSIGAWEGRATGGAAQVKPMEVYLSAPTSAQPALQVAGLSNRRVKAQAPTRQARSSRPTAAEAPPPPFPVQPPPEPHYFRLSELTDKPRVAQDVASGLILVVHDIPSQPVILRLFVNEQGGVDRVAIEDSQLPEKNERQIMEVFSKLQFQPGKIEELAVRSQFRVEVLLERAVPNGSSGEEGQPEQ